MSTVGGETGALSELFMKKDRTLAPLTDCLRFGLAVASVLRVELDAMREGFELWPKASSPINGMDGTGGTSVLLRVV